MTTPADADTTAAPRRRRGPIVLVLLVAVGVAVRAALPSVARSVLEEQGTALLEGRLTIGNVDLSLLRGLVTLDDVALRAEDAGADDPPLLAGRRLWVNLGWLALFRRTVEVQDLGLVGLSMHVDRLADGDFVLPSMKATEDAEEPEPEPEDDESEPWAVVIDRLTFEDGALQLDDHVADPPESRRLSLPTLRLADFRLQPDPDAAPGHGRVSITLDDGTVELRTRVRAVRDGFDLALALEVEDLPLDRVHVHVPTLGWSASTGRLSGLVTARVSPTDPLVAEGSVELDDLGIEVVGQKGKALAWRSLEIEADRIDLAERRASIGRVALDGGRVIVTPTAPTVLPLLPRSGTGDAPAAAPKAARAVAAPVEGAAADDEKPEEGGDAGRVVEDEEEPLEEEEAEADDGAEPAVVEAEREEGDDAGADPTVVIEDAARAKEEGGGASPGAKNAETPGAAPSSTEAPRAAGDADRPWRWSVGTLSVTDTLATVALEPPPLDVEVRKLEVKRLSSKRGNEAALHAEIGLADGALVLDGPFVLDPLGGTLTVRATDLDVGRLVAATGGLPAPLVARLDADLEVTAREDPLVVRGRVEARDVETKLEDGEEFLVACKRLAVEIGRIAVPGLLPFGNEAGVGAVAVRLANVTLDEPRVVSTLTADGVVLPTTPAEDENPTSESAAFSVVVDRLEVRDGDVRFADTTVTPPYRGRLAKLAVDAQGIRVPENRADRVTLSTRVGGKAPLEVKSVRRGDAVNVTGTMRDVPLSQFNPYATAYGYRITKGKLSLDSDTTLRGGAYDSENRIHFDRLGVSGSEGDALFKKTFGVPLGVALALLRDLDGRISLGVPVAGDERGTDVAIGSIVRQALTRAIVGALASPLKLLGAVRIGQGKIQDFDPAPIAYVPGSTRVAPGSEKQAKQLATALRQLPALRVEIVGRAGTSDARALSEQAVLTELEDEGGVLGGVRNLFSGGTRSDVRDALRARAEGEAAPLEGDAAAQLDEWVAEHPVDPARLLALATARATELETALTQGGARPDQVLVGEPKVRRKSGGAEVDVRVAEETGEPGAE